MRSKFDRAETPTQQNVMTRNEDKVEPAQYTEDPSLPYYTTDNYEAEVEAPAQGEELVQDQEYQSQQSEQAFRTLSEQREAIRDEMTRSSH